MTSPVIDVLIGRSGTVVLIDKTTPWAGIYGILAISETLSADEAERLAFKLADAAEKSRAREWALLNGATTTTLTQSEFAE